LDLVYFLHFKYFKNGGNRVLCSVIGLCLVGSVVKIAHRTFSDLQTTMKVRGVLFSDTTGFSHCTEWRNFFKDFQGYAAKAIHVHGGPKSKLPTRH